MKNLILSEAYELIKNVEYDIIMSIPKEVEEAVKNFINLDDYNTEAELRALRNYLVMIISKSYKDDYSNLRQNQTLITIITSMIDNKLFRIGAEV